MEGSPTWRERSGGPFPYQQSFIRFASGAAFEGAFRVQCAQFLRTWFAASAKAGDADRYECRWVSLGDGGWDVLGKGRLTGRCSKTVIGPGFSRAGIFRGRVEHGARNR